MQVQYLEILYEHLRPLYILMCAQGRGGGCCKKRILSWLQTNESYIEDL